MTVETAPREVPAWMADMKFCHVIEPGCNRLYCGGQDSDDIPDCPGEYDGEAICPWCGNPTCPRCAQLSDIDDALGAS